MHDSEFPLQLPRRRRWLFRLAAVVLSLSPLLVVELGLRVAGYEGRETRELDPFVDIEAARPLFEPNGELMAIPASRLEFFRPEQFPQPKPPGRFRIFCLGGSTVQGRPFAIETSFTTWLEIGLRTADPERDWEVVNCGGVSYASYRLTPILREVLDYQPDLIVLYTGQNEFLEERTYASWRQRPVWMRRAAQLLEASRTFQLARQAATADGDRDVLPAEVDAMLDYRGGLEQYHRDDRWRRAVVDHYELNVGRMIDICRESQLPVIVCNPVVNLESPPFKSEPEEIGDKRPLVDQLRRKAAQQQAAPSDRVGWLSEAVALSPRDAHLQFLLASACREMRDYENAARHFIRAKDEDICPLRMTEPLYEALHRVVQPRRGDARSVLRWCDVRRGFSHDDPPALDAQELTWESAAAARAAALPDVAPTFAPFDLNSPPCITGDRWLVDHVHPSIHGHQLIANWLLALMLEEGWAVVRHPEDFDRRRTAAYTRHIGSLPPLYFEQSRRRLEGLQRWSQGRAYQVREP